MRLIKDLGTRREGNSNTKRSFGLYECPICLKHFECSIKSVKSGNTTKCRKCADILSARNKAIYAGSIFKDKANIVHSNKYDYSLVDYISSRIKITIICKEHGEFTQIPSHHLNGCGCPICARNSNEFSRDTFVEKASKIHLNKYDYSLVNYVNNRSKITIICKEHGEFTQKPNAHLNGNGCPSCANYGFNPNKSAILYYLRVIHNGDVLYKIGITNRTVNERFNNKDLEKITVIKICEYHMGIDAYRTENYILNLHKDFAYKGEQVLSSGNTELFYTDILNLDYHSAFSK